MELFDYGISLLRYSLHDNICIIYLGLYNEKITIRIEFIFNDALRASILS